MAGGRGKVTTDYDWIKTFVPLAGRAHLLLFFEMLYSTHSVHASQSYSLCGVRCETHVTDVCSVVRGVYRMLRVWYGVCVTCHG